MSPTNVERVTFLYVLLSALISSSLEDYVSNVCSNNNTWIVVENEELDLGYMGIIKTYEDVGIAEITSKSNNNAFNRNYIDARLESDDQRKTASLVIYTTDYFAQYAEEQSSESITLQIHIDCLNANQRTLLFQQPLKKVNYYKPEFSKPSYEFNVPTPLFAGFDLSIFQSTSARDKDLSGNKIVFSSEDSKGYHITVGTQSIVGEDQKTFFAQLKTTKIIFSISKPIHFKILATDSGIPPLSSTASVIIRADPANSLPALPHFIQTVFIGELNASFELKPLDVMLDPATYSADVKFTKFGHDHEFFSIANEGNVVHVRLERLLNASDVKGLNFFQFGIEAENKLLTETERTAVFVVVPAVEGIPYDCPTSELPTYIPKFQSDYLLFTAKPNYIGSLGSVYATIKGSDAGIRYSLKVENEHLNQRITINELSGELALINIVSPSVYYFEVIAENVVTHGKGSSNVRLEVDSIIQCEAYTSVANSLIVKHIEEEKEHLEIMDVIMDQCQFSIYSVDPWDKEYVVINPKTKMLTSAAIDREDKIFAQMAAPQIKIKLKLTCADGHMEDVKSRRRRDTLIISNENTFSENRSIILTNGIPFKKDVSILSLVIVDINDNSPEFVYPKSPAYLGYPDNEICDKLFLERLTKVHAIDKDEGLNAKIRYHIQSNEHFRIDPLNGIIYPNANAMRDVDYLDLIVVATDRDGAPEGKSISAAIVVKRLSSNYFSLLSFENDNFHSVDDLIDELKTKTGYELTAVKHATLPAINYKVNNDRSLTIAPLYRNESVNFSIKIVQKVWIYAYNDMTAVTTDDIKRKLSEKLAGSQRILVESFAEAYKKGIPDNRDTENTVGYIVAICFLAIICMGFLGFFVLRLYFHKTYEGQKTTLEHDTNDEVDEQIDIPYFTKKETVDIYGSTTQETSDGDRRQKFMEEKLHNGELLISINNGAHRDGCEPNYNDTSTRSSSSSESDYQRTTVTFNELVERIHIDSDDDEKLK